MHNISKPTTKVQVVASNNGSSITLSSSTILQNEEDLFDSNMMAGNLIGVRKNKTITGVTHNTLKGYYDDFRNHAYPRKHYYDLIKSSSDKCIYCDVRDSEEIDHYLIKEEYTSLCISMLNLVPVCGICNKKKKDIPLNNFDYYFNPYYHMDFKWMHFDLHITGNIFSFKFSPINTTNPYYSYVKHTIDKLKLVTLFTEKVNKYFKDKEKLLKTNKSKGQVYFDNYIQDIISTYSGFQNDYELAFWECIEANKGIVFSKL